MHWELVNINSMNLRDFAFLAGNGLPECLYTGYQFLPVRASWRSPDSDGDRTSTNSPWAEVTIPLSEPQKLSSTLTWAIWDILVPLPLMKWYAMTYPQGSGREVRPNGHQCTWFCRGVVRQEGPSLPRTWPLRRGCSPCDGGPWPSQPRAGSHSAPAQAANSRPHATLEENNNCYRILTLLYWLVIINKL